MRLPGLPFWKEPLRKKDRPQDEIQIQGPRLKELGSRDFLLPFREGHGAGIALLP